MSLTKQFYLEYIDEAKDVNLNHLDKLSFYIDGLYYFDEKDGDWSTNGAKHQLYFFEDTNHLIFNMSCLVEFYGNDQPFETVGGYPTNINPSVYFKANSVNSLYNELKSLYNQLLKKVDNKSLGILPKEVKTTMIYITKDIKSLILFFGANR